MVPMKILSIETSCDETGVSVLDVRGNNFKVLGNSLSSQVKIHAEYGGVYPMLAKREHIKNLPILLERTLKKAKMELIKPDAIAVTTGPGLEPALWTGIVFAKDLAKKWKVPLIPVNHMEGHILSVFGKNKGEFKIPKVKFPMLALLVSGGHTELVLINDWHKYKVIGETLDDAAGEAFDKVARMLELPYPGGPQISRLAENARKNKIKSSFTLPRPMLHSKNLDFSFSGLKTSVLYLTQKLGKLDDRMKSEIALEFENSVIDTLIHKTKKAESLYGAKSLIVAGGVAANQRLRKEIRKNFKNINVLFPESKLSTDNSIMIGMVGYMKFLKNKGKGKSHSSIKAVGGLRL